MANENNSESIKEQFDDLLIHYSNLLDKFEAVQEENQLIKKELEDKNFQIKGLIQENNDLASEKEVYLIQLRESQNYNNRNEYKNDYRLRSNDKPDKKQKEKMKKQNQDQQSLRQNNNQNNVYNPQRRANNQQQINYNLRSGNNNLANQNINVDNMTYEQLIDLENKIGKVSVGLTQQQINSLHVVKFDSSRMQNIDNSCSICQSQYINQDKIRILNPCLHKMHQECVDQWLLQSKKCPICQLEVKIN